MFGHLKAEDFISLIEGTPDGAPDVLDVSNSRHQSHLSACARCREALASALAAHEAMHRALRGSRMITLDHVRTHGVYLFRGAACVDEPVNAYLNTGVLPGGDQHCTE